MPTYVHATVTVKNPEKLRFTCQNHPPLWAIWWKARPWKDRQGSAWFSRFHIMATFEFATKTGRSLVQLKICLSGSCARDEAIDGQIVIVQG